MDSNFQYAEAVKLVVAPFSCADRIAALLRTDRHATAADAAAVTCCSRTLNSSAMRRLIGFIDPE